MTVMLAVPDVYAETRTRTFEAPPAPTRVRAVAPLADPKTSDATLFPVTGSSKFVATHVVPPSKETSGRIVPTRVPAASCIPELDDPAKEIETAAFRAPRAPVAVVLGICVETIPPIGAPAVPAPTST